MHKRTLSALFLAVVLSILLGLALWVIPRLPEIECKLLEQAANRSSQEYFAGSIRIGKAAVDRHGKIRIEGLSGSLQTRQGPVPLEIRSLASQETLLFLITGKPVHFTAEGLHPRGSSRPGISGTFWVQTRPVFHVELAADFGKTDLQDWQWLDPQNLGGATGAMKGNLIFRQTAGQEPAFSMNLEAPQPGGNIQAKFFDLFLPYLPFSIQKERVQKVVKSQKLIRYDQAALTVEMAQSDLIKIHLQIFIPDYNLKLMLNANVRTDAKNAFSQIARIMGLIEVK